MVCCEWLENLINQYNVLEVVNHTLAIEKVHRRCKPVPIQALGEAQSARSRRHIGDSNNLLEGDDLNSGNDQDDVDMAHSHGEEETSNHDECPYRAGEKGLFLLLVLGGFGLLELVATLATTLPHVYVNSTYLLCDIRTGARLPLSNWLPRPSLTYVGEGRPPATVNAAGLPIPMIELDISPWFGHAVLFSRF